MSFLAWLSAHTIFQEVWRVTCRTLGCIFTGDTVYRACFALVGLQVMLDRANTYFLNSVEKAFIFTFFAGVFIFAFEAVGGTGGAFFSDGVEESSLCTGDTFSPFEYKWLFASVADPFR